MDIQQFGVFLQTRRKELEMTQSELAEKIHVTDKAISRWERGVGFPDIKLLEPLAEALEISLTELMQSKRIEQPLSAEQSMALEAETSEMIGEQKTLSRQRKLVLHLGQLAILGAAFVLVHISHQKALPFALRYTVYVIAFLGTFFANLALKFIVEKLYLDSKPWGIWRDPHTWISWAMRTMGILIVVYSNLGGVRTHNLLITILGAALTGAGYFYQKIHEEKIEE